MLGRIAAKQALVDGVIAGRVGLTEAAARFRARNAGEPAYGGVIRASYPGASDEESYCRNVIGFVAAQLKWDDARAGPVLRRLAEELERLKAGGDIRLPDVAGCEAR